MLMHRFFAGFFVASLVATVAVGCAAPEGDDGEASGDLADPSSTDDDDGSPVAESSLGADGEAEPAAGSVSSEVKGPDCLVRGRPYKSGDRVLETVRNRCGQTVRLRLIWRWAKDGSCITLPNGQTYAESRKALAGRIYPYVTEIRRCK